MKQAFSEWWNKNGKGIMTTGIILMVLLLTWFVYYAVYQQVKGENALVTKINLMVNGDPITIKESGRKEHIITFLMAGMDQSKDLDSIQIGVLDTKKKTFGLLFIPRDTLSECDRNNKKISKAYEKGGLTGLKKELKQLTGLPIDRYLIVKNDGFIKMVDGMGGVPLQIPQAMDYEDPAQRLSIHLTQGEQHLDGQKALDFVRFCSGYVDGDLGRIRAQQSFITAFSKQVLSAVKKPKQLAKIAAQAVETDLSAGELIWLAGLAMDKEVQKGFSMEVLPGISANFLESSYYVVNGNATLGMINARYNPYEEPVGALLLSNIGQNLFEGWQGGMNSSSVGFSPDLDDAALSNPLRFAEYYDEYQKGRLEDSLFADAMDTPMKTKTEELKPSPTPQKPVETLTVPKIQPTPSPEVIDRVIVLDPSQKPEDYGFDPGKVEYFTPTPTPTPEPTPTPTATPQEIESPSVEPTENGQAQEEEE